MLRLALAAALVLPAPAVAAPVARVVLKPAAVSIRVHVNQAALGGLPKLVPGALVNPVPILSVIPSPVRLNNKDAAKTNEQPGVMGQAEQAVAKLAELPEDASNEQSAQTADFANPGAFQRDDTPVPALGHPILSPSKSHGRAGRLIVVEGLDGSGKSTQLELLKAKLEKRGHKVVVTRWNSSEIVSGAVKAAKKTETLTPRTFALLNSADLADRLQKSILPALNEGAIVLADRWTYTALARDVARGNDKTWLESLYEFAPTPDLVLYFKVPVKTAIARVVARLGGGQPSLSEDHQTATSEDRQGLKFYEAGLDVGPKHETAMEHFEWFQDQVAARYDEQSKAKEFYVVDASRKLEPIHEEVMEKALKAVEGSAKIRGEVPFQLGGFLGVFANSALTVTLPFIVAAFFTSPAAAVGAVALAITLASAADALGVILGGFWLKNVPAKTIMISTNAARAGLLAALVLFGSASLPLTVGLIVADGLLRGLMDTYRGDLPFQLAGSASASGLLSRFQIIGETGRILGALGLGAALLMLGPAGLWAAPIAFLGATLAYVYLPASAPEQGPGVAQAEPSRPLKDMLRRAANPWFVSMLLAGLFFTLKGMLPGLYATSLLGDPVSTAWLFASFALGTIAGSIAQPRLAARGMKPGQWALLSAAGMAVLALAWLPMTLTPLLAGVFVFAALNGASKVYFEATYLGSLAGEARRQMIVAKRTASNVFSLAAKSGVALLLSVITEAPWAFGVVSALFLAAAGWQWRSGLKMALPAKLLPPVVEFKRNEEPKPEPIPEPSEGAKHFLAAVPTFSDEVKEGWFDEKQGFHNFQRNMTTLIQERFVSMKAGEGSPSLLLHGNPSLNNLLNLQLEDSDRAAVGPAAWDLFRPLLSFAAWRTGSAEAEIKDKTAAALRKGYLRGFTQGAHVPYAATADFRPLLKAVTKDAKAKTVKEYFEAELKWVVEMRKNPVPVDDAELKTLLSSYAQSLGSPSLLDGYEVKEAGRSESWVRGRRRYIVALKPKRGGDWLLVDIKEVHPAPATPGFKNPFPTEAERMIAVNELYSPGAMPLQGPAYDSEGTQYWGHQIVINDRKPGKLSGKELAELALAVGYQLGRGHRLSLEGKVPGASAELNDSLKGDPEAALAAVEALYPELVKQACAVLENLKEAYGILLAQRNLR